MGGGGGGGFLGQVLNVASIFYPPLRPIAIGFNVVNNLNQGNVLGAAVSGLGGVFGSMGPGMDAGSLGAASDLAGGAEAFVPNWGNAVSDYGDISSMDVGQGQYAMDANQIAYNNNDIMEQMGGGPNIDPNNITSTFSNATEEGLGSIFSNASNAQFNAPTLEQAAGANDFLQGYQDMNAQGIGLEIPTMGAVPSSAGGVPQMDVGQSLTTSGTDSLGNLTQAPEGVNQSAFNSGVEMPAENTGGGNWGGGSADVQMANDPGQYGYGGSELTSAGGNMFAPNQPQSGGNIFEKIMQAQKQTPLQQGVRAIGGIDSWMQGRKAQDQMRGMYDQAMQSANFNNGRGAAANQMWQQNFQDPQAGFQDYMRGAGREALNNAMLTSANKGKRSYMNSGKMQSDLQGQWMKNQFARGQALSQGFANPGGAQVAANFAPAMAGMTRNQNAPLFDAAANIFQSNRLSDIFGNNNSNSYLADQY